MTLQDEADAAFALLIIAHQVKTGQASGNGKIDIARTAAKLRELKAQGVIPDYEAAARLAEGLVVEMGGHYIEYGKHSSN